MSEGKLTIVMPAYNEGGSIHRNLCKVCEVVREFWDDFEIVAVNDGSTDQTRQEILRAKQEDSRIRMISYRKNRGKGHAIRRGVRAASGRYIAFLDADLDLPPGQLKTYLEELTQDRADVVIGSKLHRDSHIEYPLIRKVMSGAYYGMLKVLFGLNVKDTQTGIKVFRADALKSVIDQIQAEGYAYDIEILAALSSRGYRIKEMPVQLVYTRDKGMGRIRFMDIWNVFWDTLKIFYRARVLEYYDRQI